MKGQHGTADAYDLFVLAMCHQRLGDADKARNCQDRAVRWCQEHEGGLPVQQREELKVFRQEAAAMLKPP